MRRVVAYLRVSAVAQNNAELYAAAREQYLDAEIVEKEGMTVSEANMFGKIV